MVLAPSAVFITFFANSCSKKKKKDNHLRLINKCMLELSINSVCGVCFLMTLNRKRGNLPINAIIKRLLSLPLSQYWSIFTIHPNEQQTSIEDYLLLVLLQTCTTQSNKGTLRLFWVLSGTDVVGSLWSLSGHGAPTQADNHGLSTVQCLHYPAPVLVICRLILSVFMQYVSHQVVTTFTWAYILKHYRIGPTMLMNQNFKAPVE